MIKWQREKHDFVSLSRITHSHQWCRSVTVRIWYVRERELCIPASCAVTARARLEAGKSCWSLCRMRRQGVPTVKNKSTLLHLAVGNSRASVVQEPQVGARRA